MRAALNNVARYGAIQEKNKRYDGIFYFAVLKTGLYCRPSCSSEFPRQKNCFYFDTTEQAKTEGYSPCKNCHPDRLKDDLSVEILGRIDSGAINDEGVHGLADSLHISERHLRRIVQDRTGTSPLLLNKAKRLQAARLLITQTKLPIIDVAFKVGFSSLRQFNDVFKNAFKVTPSEMRKFSFSMKKSSKLFPIATKVLF